MSRYAPEGIVSGDWYAHCATCGHRFYGSTLRAYYQGGHVCDKCWEPRPQRDTMKPRPEKDRKAPFVQTGQETNDSPEQDTSYTPGDLNWYGYPNV